MIVRRALLVLCLVLLPVSAFAVVSADVGVTASDSPDPVAPDGNITYTVHVTNAGPSTATTAHMSVILNGTLLWQSMTVPAGWNCPVLSVGHGASFTCTAATLASGSDDVFTVVLNAGKNQVGINNTTLNELFTVNANESDPNSGNNSVTVQTSYVAPHADVQVTATDSPDPVAPDGNITYTVTVTNAGPDATTNAHMSVILNGTLLWQSMTVPAGWSCPSLAVGHGASFTCTAATLATPSTSVFTVVLKAGVAQFGVLSQTINELFTVSSDWADPNNANNAVTVSTAYHTPSVDMQVSAIDSPDPVAPDGNITYTVTVTNAGPDPAANAAMSVFGNNTLLFQSITIPSGWTCPAVPVGNGGGFTCHATTLAAPTTSVFTVVLKAAKSQIGIFDQTLNQLFSVGSDWADPNNGNNAVTVQTAYVAPHADLQITATDAPDPVFPDGNITYTVTVVNAGPNATTNASMTAVNNTLQFQSVSAPAGWTCPALAVGHGGAFDCAAANLATPSTSVFTIVLKAAQAAYGNSNQTINEVFVISSDWSDPVNGNNTANVSTAYVVPTANLAVTNGDSPDPVSSGATITYTQTLTNNGPDSAANAKITELVPSGTTFQSISSPAGFNCTTPAIGGTGTITCTTASMANAATASFTLVVNVTAPSGIVTNTVSGSSDASDPVPSNNSVAVTTTITAPPSADLGITKSTPTTNAAPGASVTYTIVVTNHGPDAATSATMTDVLPASLLFQSITSPGGFSCTTPTVGTTGTISCTSSSLTNGASATFALVVTSVSNASGSIGNTASVSGTPSDPVSGNNSATASFTAGSADLGVSGTGTVNGTTITYIFTVTNAGPNGAVNPVFTDTLPSSLRFGSITPPPGWNCTTPPVGTTGTISCTASSIGNGGTGTFTIVTSVVPGTTGMINNGAGVSSGTSDPNSGNSATGGPSIAAPATDVPALSTWALLLLAAMLGLAAVMKMR